MSELFQKNKTQALAFQILNTHLKSKKVSGAYLISGEIDVPQNQESDKTRLALRFAAAMLSESANLLKIEENISRRVEAAQHPDFLWVGKDQEARYIKKEEMSGLLAWAVKRPFESGRRVALVSDAQRMTEEAANAFLKTLEESPGRNVFILTTAEKHHLLETIVSRCFEVRFPALSQADRLPVSSILLRDILEGYGTGGREDLNRQLDELYGIVYSYLLQLHEVTPSAGESGRRALRALEVIYEAKTAVEANANLKLTVTRLVMHLKNIFRGQKTVPV